MRSRRLGSICRFPLSPYWCINQIVLRAEWWFDGKQFSSLNHMKSNCSSYSSCLQGVSRAIGFRQLLYATLFDTVEQKDRDKLFCVLSVSLWMPVSHEISRFNRCVSGLSSWLSSRSSTLSVFSLTHTQNTVCRCRVADESYPLFGFSLTMCRYFHILSTYYEPVCQILGLKELMCK